MEPRKDFKHNDRVKVPSGMGGIFDGKIVSEGLGNRFSVEIDNPQHPDWHKKIIWFHQDEIKKVS